MTAYIWYGTTCHTELALLLYLLLYLDYVYVFVLPICIYCKIYVAGCFYALRYVSHGYVSTLLFTATRLQHALKDRHITL